ncbi:YqaJ viral recombinase family protein [Streptomyces sp. NPDC012888]|uniref:YqaJ viral recombinase family nuclease n=1 Tax=Streptomyces sp. NPDC012888 TaxID=3364855 RepID=UPI003682AE1F
METPTGVLLGEYTPGTPEWEQARAGLCITATQIAAVMGRSPWASRYSLWHQKAGLPVPPFQPNPAIEWGNRLESSVAQKWQDEHPGHSVQVTGTWRHRDRGWQRATPDRIVVSDRAVELLEVKTSPFGQEWLDDVPLHYYIQIQWQLDTLGLDVCHVAVLISGHDYREFTVEYDEGDAAVMRSAAEEFLDSVRRGEAPNIDGSQVTYDTIRRQPDRYDPTDVEIPGPIAARYEIAQGAAKAASDELTAAKSLLLAALGTGRNAVHLGRRIAYRTAREDGTTIALQPAR